MPPTPFRALRRLAALALATVALAAGGLLTGAPEAGAEAGWRAGVDESALPVRYTIEAALRTLPDEAHPRQIQGRETIVWANLSHDRVENLWFHLYANAFRNEQSAFVRERRRDGGDVPDDMVWGGIEIQRLSLLDSPDRQPTMEFVPEPDAPDDRTVLRVKLPRPVEPGGRVVLQVDFTTALPKPVARMGAAGDFVFAAQWYPKLGRHLGSESRVPNLTPDGWYCPHYHAAGEFAPDYADYDVTLDVPLDWTLGATGVPDPNERTDPATRRRVRRYQARSVVDFAWTAGLRTREIVRTIDPDDFSATDAVTARVSAEVRHARTLLGLAPGDADLPPIEVALLIQPEHEDQADRHFEAARVALALYGTWLGPYPYPRLTIVDPAQGAGAVGGMEYPTLVTAGTSVGSPVDARRPEHVVVHEIGHQWFMNLLANNETEEAWLDEGLNTWFTARAMHVAWGPPAQHTDVLGFQFPYELPYTFPGLDRGWPDLLGLPAWAHPPEIEAFRLWRDGPALFSSRALRYREDQSPALPSRRSYLRSAGWDELVRTSWRYASGRSYGGNAYPRSVLLLESIDRHVRAQFPADGELRTLRAFREYARQFRFRHPTTADLLRVLRVETELSDVPQLFDALARSTGLLDYAVDSVRVVDESKDAAGATIPARTEIVVRRRGSVAVPVSVRVDLHDAADDATLRWTAEEQAGEAWHRFTVAGRAKTVELDPGRLFPQDVYRSDNSWSDRRTAQPGVKWGVRLLLWLQNALTGWGRFL